MEEEEEEIKCIKEGNVLFNDALNTFYLRLYSVGQIHSAKVVWSELNCQEHSILHHPTDRIAFTMVFVISVEEHWLEREITQ